MERGAYDTLFWLLIIGVVYPFMHELNEISNNFRAYFLDAWNYLDVTSILLAICNAII